jgi:hypothetical protein
MTKTIFVLLVLLFSARAFAADGNHLSELCSVADKQELKSDELPLLTGCINYINGVLDTQIMWQSLTENEHQHKKSICAEEGINPMQSAKIVAKYLRDNPDKLHWTGAALVVNAIHLAFPCPK